MQITAELNSIESLDKEIKRLSIALRDLRKQKKACEDRVNEFINNNQEHSGIKYKGNQFTTHTRNVIDRTRSAKSKESDALDVLKKYGMSENDSKKLFEEMQAAYRGPRKEETKLLVKKLNNRGKK